MRISVSSLSLLRVPHPPHTADSPCYRRLDFRSTRSGARAPQA
jgi:hypothetical protein